MEALPHAWSNAHAACLPFLLLRTLGACPPAPTRSSATTPQPRAPTSTAATVSVLLCIEQQNVLNRGCRALFCCDVHCRAAVRFVQAGTVPFTSPNVLTCMPLPASLPACRPPRRHARTRERAPAAVALQAGDQGGQRLSVSAVERTSSHAHGEHPMSDSISSRCNGSSHLAAAAQRALPANRVVSFRSDPHLSTQRMIAFGRPALSAKCTPSD